MPDSATPIRPRENLPWAIQIVVNVLALSLDVPLRLFDSTGANKLYSGLCKGDYAFAQKYRSEEDFRKAVSEICQDPKEGIRRLHSSGLFDTLEKLPKSNSLGRQIWRTRPSHIYPLLQAFREHSPWKYWEYLWFYNACKSDPMQDAPRDFGFDDRSMQVAAESLATSDLVLVGGPVWKPVNDDSEEQFFGRRITPVVDAFLDALGECKHKYDKNRLQRIAGGRFALSSRDLKQRLKVAGRVLNLLVPIVDVNPEGFRQSDIVAMTEWVLFCVRLQIDFECHATIMGNGHPDQILSKALIPLLYRCDCSTEEDGPADNPGVTSQMRALRTIWRESEEGTVAPDFSFEDWPDATKITAEWTGRLLPGSGSLDGLDGDRQQLLNALDIRLSNHLAGNGARDHAEQMENLFLMGEWLDDQFGVLTSKQGEDWNEAIEVTTELLAKRTRRLLEADIASVYRYDFGTRILKTLGLDHIYDDEGTWGEQFPEIMEEVGKAIETDRPESLSYRVVDLQKSQFVRYYDAENRDKVPVDQRFVKLDPEKYPDLEAARSGIAVSIDIFGRTWGILEVLGMRYHQFRWRDLRRMEEIASLIGPFYYQQWLVNRLHFMDLKAVDAEMSIDDKYQDICEGLSDLFMCRGIVLWVRETKEIHSQKFVCRGWHGRPDLDENKKMGKRPFSFLEGSDNTISLLPRADGEVWHQGILGQEPFSGKWLKKSHTRTLKNLGFKHVCLVPVQDSSESIIASISMFSDHEEGYDEKWRNLIAFVASHVGLLLEAMHVDDQWKHLQRRIVVHQANAHAKEMTSTAEKILNFVQRETRTFASSDTYRLNQWRKDILAHGENLVGSVSQLRGIAKGQPMKGNEGRRKIMEQFRLPGRPSHVNLRDQFNRVFMGGTYSERKSRNLEIKYNGPAKGPYVSIHAENLREILSNLASNALKYADPGSLILAETSMTRTSCKLVVKNLAPHMDLEDELRLFEADYRGLLARQRGIPGDGLGLYTSSVICDIYKMSLGYHSEPFKADNSKVWHCFTLYIPLSKARTEAPR